MRIVLAGVASVGLVTGAQAANVLSSSFEGEIRVGIFPVIAQSTANPTSLDITIIDPFSSQPGVPRPAQVEEGQYSRGHFDASTTFGPNFSLTFEHEQFGYGVSSGEGVTRIVDVFTNDAPVPVAYSLTSTILPGRLALASIFLDNELEIRTASETSVRRLNLSAMFDFVVLLDGVPLYQASASLASGGGTLVDLNGGSFLDFEGLTREERSEYVYYEWDVTDIVIDLGVFASGQTRTIEYIVTTGIGADTFCVIEDNGCGAAQSAFADPRGGGIIITNFAAFEEAVLVVAPTVSQVPAPPALALFGLGMLAVALKRRG